MVARSLDGESEYQLIDYYNSGMSLYECAFKFSISYSSVRRILTRHTIPIRTYFGSKRKYDVNDHFFDVINTEEKAYFFGLLYADGNVNSKTPSITIKLQECDKHIIETLNKYISTDRPLVFIPKQNENWENAYLLTIRSNHMKSVLVSYGMVPAKSLVKKFPEVILNSDEDIIRHFIRGYFDGNGFIGIYNNRNDTGKYVSMCISTTLEMCSSIAQIYKQYLNIDSYIDKTNKSNDTNNYKIWVYGRDRILIVLDWFYKDATTFMDRKYKLYKDAVNLPVKRRIKRI